MVRPIKVAFLCQLNASKDMGGADIHIRNLLNALSDSNALDIHVLTLSKTVNESTKKKEGRITYHILSSPKLPRTITGITIDHRMLIKKVNELNPDIIHAQVLGAPYGLAAMKLCKQYPTVLTVHTLVDLDARNRRGTVKEKIHDGIWRNLERKEIASIPNFIAVSNSVEEELKKRGAQNVHVIPNGISEDWFNIPNNEVDGRILFVGRVIPIKAIETLIHALKIVKIQTPKAHLYIVGPASDKEYKSKLDTLITKFELQGSVTFTGPKNGQELEKEYSECSVFILPSKNESNPIVLLEAMATGKPIVASNVGGIPEILDNDVEGYLVEQGNAEQFADRIIKLLADSNLRHTMGLAGKERAGIQTWKLIAEKTVNCYKEILGESR